MDKPKVVLPGQIWEFTNGVNEKFIHTITRLDPGGERCYSDVKGRAKSSGYLVIDYLLKEPDWSFMGHGNAIKGPDGATCSKCNTFAPMAGPNNPDGSFTCRGCKLGF